MARGRRRGPCLALRLFVAAGDVGDLVQRDIVVLVVFEQIVVQIDIGALGLDIFVVG